ncbi:MAG TPA: hypothetical protein VEJ20_03270 [Candidatus Eremiobacteraceae bacterium]|nr:hypothetical protein [Candidatus Eremiobacteraceae bacterium]
MLARQSAGSANVLPAAHSIGAAATASATISQTHVLTWDAFDLGGGANTPVTPALAAPWLSWLMIGSANSGEYHAVGIQTMYYTQPNRQGPGGPEYSSDESTFAHTCAGNGTADRIKTTNYGLYLMDPGSAELGDLWQQEALTVRNSWGGQFDAIYEDLTDTIYYTNGTPCDFTQSAWSNESNSLSTYITSQGFQLIYNGLAALAPGYSMSPTIAMNASTTGGMFEGCYTTNGDPWLLHNNTWITTEDTEIQMADAGKLFFCRGLDTNSAESSAAARLYQYASFLLTYRRHTSVYSTSFATADLFNELPETELVPTDPVQAYPSTVSALLQTSGVYGRQFSACYIAGVLVGPCAVAINESTNASLPFPWPGVYPHTIALSGADIPAGGTISALGPAPPSQVPSLSGVIAIQ